MSCLTKSEFEINFSIAARIFAGRFFNWNAYKKESNAIWNFNIFREVTNILGATDIAERSPPFLMSNFPWLRKR